MALPKTSVPGMVTLSPTARPDIEMMRFASKALEPVTLIPAMLYSFGILELNISTKAGLTETGIESWAKTNWLLNKIVVTIKIPL